MKKRSYYRKIEYYRQKQRSYHHYLKYCKGNCAICSSTTELQVHHIQAQSLGGESTKDNVITVCLNCHKFITKYYQAVRGINKAGTPVPL